MIGVILVIFVMTSCLGAVWGLYAKWTLKEHLIQLVANIPSAVVAALIVTYFVPLF